MLHICPYCAKTLSTKFNLQRHVDRDCSVIQVSKTIMNDLRVGRSEERGEVALRKKSKSRERGVIDECVDDFDAQTADRVFERIFTSGTNFKGLFDNQVPVVQALLLDKFSRERLIYLQEKAEFEERQRRFQVIDTAFHQLQSPQSQPNVSTTTSATTSNSAIQVRTLKLLIPHILSFILRTSILISARVLKYRASVNSSPTTTHKPQATHS
jgi:hypothetical protein